MNLKLRIKLCFLKHDYEQLKEIIVWNENGVNYLNIKELKILLEYAKANQELILLNTLLNCLIKSPLDKEYEDLIESYLNDFLQVALENPVFLYSVASMMSKKKDIFKKQIEEIKKYILNVPLSEITVCIHTLDGFYEKEMEEKIIKESIPRFIFCLLENVDIENTRRILIEYLLTQPSNAKIYRLAEALSSSDTKLEELLSVILGLDLPNKVKSGYLLSVFEGTHYLTATHYMKKELIKLNDLVSIDKLMQKETEEKQTDWILEYQEEGKKEILFTLACTTDTPETKILINTFLDHGSDREILILAAFVKEKFLPDLFAKLITKSPEKLLKVLDNLYLFGSNRWCDLIDFIVVRHEETKFPREIQERLIRWHQNKQKGKERKRTLTE